MRTHSNDVVVVAVVVDCNQRSLKQIYLFVRMLYNVCMLSEMLNWLGVTRSVIFALCVFVYRSRALSLSQSSGKLQQMYYDFIY